MVYNKQLHGEFVIPPFFEWTLDITNWVWSKDPKIKFTFISNSFPLTYIWITGSRFPFPHNAHNSFSRTYLKSYEHNLPFVIDPMFEIPFTTKFILVDFLSFQKSIRIQRDWEIFEKKYSLIQLKPYLIGNSSGVSSFFDISEFLYIE